jgi:hypothetical protein
MSEETRRRYAPLGVVIAVIVAVVGFALVFGAGQTSRILSTVGSAIGPTTGGGGSGEGTTGEDSKSESGSGGTAGSGSSGAEVADAAAGPPTLLIVRTGTLELEVAALDATIAAAARVVTSADGYVSSSNETAAGDRANATVVYRIPAAAWDATLAALRGLARTVRHQQVDTEEVTGQVVDLGARISNLRAAEGALQAIMVRATKIRDVLDVQRQLTTTRGEIERLVADKATLEGRAAYGSLRVTFNLPAPAAVVAVQKGWNPAADVDQATGKLIRIGQRTTSAGIFLAIIGLPLLIACGIGMAVAWQLYRVGRWLVRRRSTGIVVG